jgi:hypothetical protein
MASFVSISLLQSRSPSSPKRRRQEGPADLQIGFSPYQSLAPGLASASPSPRRPPSPSLTTPAHRPAVQSPTLDLSLFVFVRASESTRCSGSSVSSLTISHLHCALRLALAFVTRQPTSSFEVSTKLQRSQVVAEALSWPLSPLTPIR